jgi:hypothetical protein
MEADPSDEKWNYPIYSYAYSSAKRRNRRVEVKLNVAYTKDSNREYNESPHIRRIKYFHYMLELDEDGDIVGGSFYRDSSVIDILWVPMRPRPGGRAGNERGNPYVDVKQVLAVWRESVDEEVRNKWFNIQPSEEDRILDLAGVEGLVPLQGLAKVRSKPPAVEPEELKPDEASKKLATANTEEGDSEATGAEPASGDAEDGDSETSNAEPTSGDAENGGSVAADEDPPAADDATSE